MKQIDVIKIKRLDKDTITIELKTINDDLSDFYNEIGCSTIDIVQRRFGGVLFDIILDDEGLFKDHEWPTSWWQDMTGKYTPNHEGLFGTLLLCHGDSEGNLVDADLEDLVAVQKASANIRTKDGDELMLLFHDQR